MEYKLFFPGWDELKEIATLQYGSVTIKMSLTFIHHLHSILSIAKGSSLFALDQNFMQALKEIECEMRKALDNA